MKVEAICFNAVKFSIAPHLRLPLVEVALGSGLAVQLLDLIAAGVEKIAVVCFLVAGSEPSKDQDVFRRNLVQTTPLKTDPVCVLFDPQI